MKEDNGRMEVITRTEFEDEVRMFVTKEDLNAALTETKNEIVATVSTSIADGKIDMIESVRNLLSSWWIDEKMRDKKAVSEAKVEILGVFKKTITEAVAPVTATLDGIDARLDGMDTRLNGLEAKMNGLEVRQKVIAKNVEDTMTSMSEQFSELGTRLKAAGF